MHRQRCQTGLGPWFLVTHALVCMETEEKWRLCSLPALTALCFAR